MKTAILSSHDYEPYGSALPYRGFEASKTEDKYKFGFNSQEMDFDIIEGLYGAEFWEYDSRTGRRWNVDPVVYASISGYSCFLGNPIYFVDPSGASAVGAWLKKAVTNIKKGFGIVKKEGKAILTLAEDMAKEGIEKTDEMADEVYCCANAKRSNWFSRAMKTVATFVKNVVKSGIVGLAKQDDGNVNSINDWLKEHGENSYSDSHYQLEKSNGIHMYSDKSYVFGPNLSAKQHDGPMMNADVLLAQMGLADPVVGVKGGELAYNIVTDALEIKERVETIVDLTMDEPNKGVNSGNASSKMNEKQTSTGKYIRYSKDSVKKFLVSPEGDTSVRLERGSDGNYYSK